MSDSHLKLRDEQIRYKRQISHGCEKQGKSKTNVFQKSTLKFFNAAWPMTIENKHWCAGGDSEGVD